MATQVGGATNNSAVGVTTLTVTYTPTNGNVIVLVFAAGVSITNVVVKDNNNVVLNAGPVQGSTSLWYYTVTGSPTSFTITWTTSAQCSAAVEEYSGAAVDSLFSTFHNNGTSTTATLSITPLQSNNWIVVGLSSANTITGSVGNQRQQVTASTARVTLMDNTTGSPITCSGTLTSAAWNTVGVILGAAGQAIGLQDVELVVTQPTTAQVRVPQDITLVVVNQTNAKATVSQEVLLVLVSNNRLRQLQVRKPITVWRKKPKKHAIQIPLGNSMHAGGRRIGPKSFTSA